MLSILHVYFEFLQEQIRSKQLENNIQRTDSLLYQMIPKIIADKLREGETPLNTCKVSFLVIVDVQYIVECYCQQGSECNEYHYH